MAVAKTLWNGKLQLIPTIITIPTFILLLILGGWQLQRLNDKNNKIIELTGKTNIPAVDLPTIINNLADLRYRKFTVHGRYLHNKEIFLYAGSRSRYQQDGFLLFTPLKTLDNKIIMINRGWIPSHLKSAVNRMDTLESGIVEVTGYLMLSEPDHWLIPDNNLIKNIWFRINLVEMQSFVNEDIAPYYLMRTSSNKAYPISNKLDLNLRNNHLEYAITWFAAAFTLITIFFLYHKNNRPKN